MQKLYTIYMFYMVQKNVLQLTHFTNRPTP